MGILVVTKIGRNASLFNRVSKDGGSLVHDTKRAWSGEYFYVRLLDPGSADSQVSPILGKVQGSPPSRASLDALTWAERSASCLGKGGSDATEPLARPVLA